MIYNYNKPSELLARQKQTGESYWDMIGKPLPEYKRGKSVYQQFVETHRRGLYRYLKAHNLPTTALDNMVRQMAWESTYGTSNVAKKYNNYGGYGYNGKTYTNFRDDEDFYKAYVGLINKMGALREADTNKYARILKNKGYYGDSYENYSKNLNSMKQAEKWILNEQKYNKQFYGNPEMKLSDFDGDDLIQKKTNPAPVDNTFVEKPEIVPQTPNLHLQPVSYDSQYQSSLPDIMQTYQRITSGQMPLQTLNNTDYGYEDYTEA